VAKVDAGGEINLKCRMSYHGDMMPSMTWYAGDNQLESVDDSSVAIKQEVVTRSATIDDDRRPFRCVASLGDLRQVCEVVVEVPRELRVISSSNSTRYGRPCLCFASRSFLFSNALLGCHRTQLNQTLLRVQK